jgi:hypothetical protein
VADVVKRIEVHGKEIGLENLKAKLRGVAQEQEKVAVSADQMTRAQGSSQSRLNRLQRTLDPVYRSTQQIAAAERTLNQALAQGQISRERHTALMAMATRRYEVNTVAARANAQATHAVAAASRAAAFRQRQLAVQSLDVAQSLALGMPPAMVAIQQGGQLAGIYAGQGGLSGAFREATSSVLGFARAHPVLIVALTAMTLATTGYVAEVREAADANYSLGQIALATAQEVAAGLNTVLGPAIRAVGDLFDTVSRAIMTYMGRAIDTTINGFEFGYRAILETWSQLPSGLGDLVFQAAQSVLDGINAMMARTRQSLNAFIETVNGTVNIWDDIPLVGEVPRLSVGNPFAGAASGLASEVNRIAEESFADSPTSDFIAGVVERLRGFSDEAVEAGRSASAASGPMNLLGESVRSLESPLSSVSNAFKGFFQNFNQQLQQGASVWDAFRDSAVNALGQIADTITGQFLNSLFQVNGAGGGGLLNYIFGAVGSAFGGGGSSFNSIAWLQNLPSMEGGGFTGHGPRSGGVDGRGGFLMIGHPNETMIDHTRGMPRAANSNAPQPITVRVINQGEPVEARVQQRQGANGPEIDVILDQIGAQKMLQPGSNMNTALKSLGVAAPVR